jgi:hypothetical protein
VTACHVVDRGFESRYVLSPCWIKLSVKLFEAGDLDHEPCGKGSALLRRKGLKALLGSIPR